MLNSLVIRETIPADRPWIKEFMDRDWGGEPLVVRVENFYLIGDYGIPIRDEIDLEMAL